MGIPKSLSLLWSLKPELLSKSKSECASGGGIRGKGMLLIRKLGHSTGAAGGSNGWTGNARENIQSTLFG